MIACKKFSDPAELSPQPGPSRKSFSFSGQAGGSRGLSSVQGSVPDSHPVDPQKRGIFFTSHLAPQELSGAILTNCGCGATSVLHISNSFPACERLSGESLAGWCHKSRMKFIEYLSKIFQWPT